MIFLPDRRRLALRFGALACAIVGHKWLRGANFDPSDSTQVASCARCGAGTWLPLDPFSAKLLNDLVAAVRSCAAAGVDVAFNAALPSAGAVHAPEPAPSTSPDSERGTSYMSRTAINLPLHHIDAVDLERACREASAARAASAKDQTEELKERYDKKMCARYAELADLVKRRTDGKEAAAVEAAGEPTGCKGGECPA